MKKMTALILSLIILSAVPGCSDKAKGSLVSTNPDRSFSSEPESLVRDSEYNYEVREILCENKGKKIYGKAYVPVADGKVPLVIACHGFGTNHEIGEGYAEEYAKHDLNSRYKPFIRLLHGKSVLIVEITVFKALKFHVP